MKKTVVLALAVVLGAANTVAKPSSRSRTQGKSTTATVRAVYTMVGCPHCVVLENALRRAGVRLTKSYTDEYRYASYPTVVYSDGRADNGQRFYNRKAKATSPVRVIEAR